MRKVCMPVKILYTIPDFLLNAYLRHVVDFCSYLNRDFFSPLVAATNIDDPGVELLRALDVPILKIQLYPRPKKLRLHSVLTAATKIKQQEIVLQHSFHWSSLWFEGLIAKMGGVKAYLTTKTGMEWDNHKFNWYIRCALSDKIIALNNTMLETFLAANFRNKTVMIPLGIDVEKFKPDRVQKKYREKFAIPANAFVLGYIAQFVPRKDHITLIQAFWELVKEGFPVYLMLAGAFRGDSYQETVLRLCNELNVQDRVFFTGSIEDTHNFLNELDCFVCTSSEESFGMVVIEAMGCGLPVVCTKTDGPREIILDGQSGQLVMIGDHHGVKNAIIKYIKNPVLRRKHGDTARQRINECYSIQSMIRRHEDVYVQTLREKGFVVA